MKTVRMEFDNLRDIYSHFEILSASQHLVDRAGSAKLHVYFTIFRNL